MRVSTVIVFLIVGGLSACAGSGTLSPRDLLARPSTYDGKTVSVVGTVANYLGYVSYDRSNPGVTFDLCAASSCVHVYEYADQGYTDGQSTMVRGAFSIRKERIVPVLL
jgi:hypothetical protein